MINRSWKAAVTETQGKKRVVEASTNPGTCAHVEGRKRAPQELRSTQTENATWPTAGGEVTPLQKSLTYCFFAVAGAKPYVPPFLRMKSPTSFQPMLPPSLVRSSSVRILLTVAMPSFLTTASRRSLFYSNTVSAGYLWSLGSLTSFWLQTGLRTRSALSLVRVRWRPRSVDSFSWNPKRCLMSLYDILRVSRA